MPSGSISLVCQISCNGYSTKLRWCIRGCGIVSLAVGWFASVVLDGFKDNYHPYTVKGQQLLFERENRPEKIDGWYQVPGKVDRSSYFLLVYFALSVVMLWLFNALI